MSKHETQWTYDERGILTCSKKIRGKWYRCKSEVLVLNEKGEIFLAFKKNGRQYNIPGGGWDKDDVDDVETVIRETLEEAHMKICDIHYKTSYLKRYETVSPNNSWIGAYIKVYVATFDGMREDFHTKEIDRNRLIEKSGRWYKLAKVYKRLSANHQYALKEYIDKIKI